MGATLLDRTTGPQTEADIAAAGDTRYLLDTRLLNINGGVEVSQELGLTGATLASGTLKYVADMWQGFYAHAAGTAVIASGQIASSSFPVALNGFPNGIQIKATTALTAPANGDGSLFRTKIEGLRCARLGWGAANPASVSYGFWFYATVSGTIFVRFENASGGARAYHHEHVVTGGIWNWCAWTIPGDATGTWAKDNTTGIIVDIFVAGKDAAPATPDAWSGVASFQTTNNTNLLVNNNNVCIVTGLVIVPGTAIPNNLRLFGNMRTYDEELLLCRRYYLRQGDGTNRFLMAYPYGTEATSSFRRVSWAFAVQMRAAPTITQTAVTTGTFAGGMPTSGNTTIYGTELALDLSAGGAFYSAVTQGTADARL